MARVHKLTVVGAMERCQETSVEVLLPEGWFQNLPVHIVSDILNKVLDARDVANCMATCKTMHEAAKHIQCLILMCRKKDHQARPFLASAVAEDETLDAEGEETDDEDIQACEYCLAPVSSPPKQLPVHVSFKNSCLSMLRHVSKVEELRIELDKEMQEELFVEEETNFWLSGPIFVRKWVSLCSHSLRQLTVVDYCTYWSIKRQSPIIKVLSESCKNLQHLELRNMYLDTNDLEVLPKLQTLALICIKMTDKSVTDINYSMPALVAVSLLHIFGVHEVRISSPTLQFLRLDLATTTTVNLDLPSCTRLRLGLTCANVLRVRASSLTSLVVRMDNHENSVIEFHNVRNLRDLLFSAFHFEPLSKLMRTDPNLESVFLDVPCMNFRDSGVLEFIPRALPDIEALGDACPAIKASSWGPGLWYAMEKSFIAGRQELAAFCRWPALSRLVVHLVVLNSDTSIAVLQYLVDVIPSLQSLEVYVHSGSDTLFDSPVDPQLFSALCREQLVGVPRLHLDRWSLGSA